MNTNVELWKYAKALRIPLRAVVTKDRLGMEPLQNGGYVINLQDDYRVDGYDQQGTHWVAFWVENGKSVYFNSFGLAPPAEVQLFLWKYRPILYNSSQIQNIQSGWCGVYCLAFLKYMSSSTKISLPIRFQRFLDFWDDDVENNLRLLKRLMGKQFFK